MTFDAPYQSVPSSTTIRSVASSTPLCKLHASVQAPRLVASSTAIIVPVALLATMYCHPILRRVLSLAFSALCVASIPAIFCYLVVNFIAKLKFSPKLFAWFLYCQVLKGPFCGHTEIAPPSVGTLVSIVDSSASSASDIFQSVVNLADPYSLRLHQAEILELALAIQCSPTFEDIDGLAAFVWEFGDVTRDIKDSLAYINSRAINVFSTISFEVS